MAKNSVKPTLLLIWHEAGNPLYWDRFYALSEQFELTVFGFDRFQGIGFKEIRTNEKFRAFLFKSYLSFHWLTVFSTTLVKKLISNRFDYIYIHEEPHSLLAFLTAIFSKNAKVVIDAAVINRRLNFNRLNIFERFVYHRLIGIFYRNDDVRKILLKRGASDRKMRCRLGNGVSKKTFRKIDTIRLAGKLKRLPAKKQGRMIVGYAGRIWQWKGVENLIDIANLPNIDVVACGPVWEKDLATKLEDNEVTILPKLGRDDLTKFYSYIDLFVLPSLPSPNWTEQFGRVIVESVFCGTPAIGSDTGFIPNLVGEKAVFKAGDKVAIQKLVTKYSSSQARLDLLAKQSQRLQRDYSWEAIAKKVKTNLEKI
ncbi:glycosyltransferase family 4 protein [Desulfospira joergensenii]|uniref:glycosyltransferase family 4 protein n=1 Tax=Desulfospira joergensenii TaxID=53329 RepID=UPI00040C0772|nr:glycosyltransferase family 4 protein [Desulfospira joergensenii]